MFDIDIQKKLVKVDFIAIFIDGTTDRAVKEQKVLYVMYVEPETQKPNFSYFEVIEMDKFDQTAPKILAAIKGSFTKHNLSEFLDKLIYFSADGISGNSKKDWSHRTNPGRTWLGIVRMVFQSSAGIGTAGCTEKFYKRGGRIVDALVLSLINNHSKKCES